MSRVFNGSSQYLSASSNVLTDEPIDMLVWGNSTDAANVQGAVNLGNNGASGFMELAWQGNVASDPIRANKQNDAGGNGVAASSSGYSTDTWHAGWASFISNTSRAAGIDGGSKGTNATSLTDPTPDFVTIGARRTSAIAAYFAGQEAEAYILDTNLSDDQHASWGAGFSPLWFLPITNVRAWYPLHAHDNNNMSGGYPDLTATNSPTQGVHPPDIIYPFMGALVTL
jgi:hypothetical protein